jgi:transposase-like protein
VEDVAARRNAYSRKWRIKHSAVADSLQEADDRLFTFTRLPPSHWRTFDAVLGVARLRSDQYAQDQRLVNTRHQAHRSADWPRRVIGAAAARNGDIY